MSPETEVPVTDELRNLNRLKWIAIFAIFFVGVLPPFVAMFWRYSDQSMHVQYLADTQATLVGRYASANPDSWMYKVEHIALHLKSIRPDKSKTVIEYQGSPVIELGEAPSGVTIDKASEFSVHGQTVGRVRVIQAIEHFQRDVSLVVLFSLLVSGFLFWLLRHSVTNPLVHAIEERERLAQELAEQARTDYLTGVCNRREFVRQSDMALRAIVRYGGTLSLLVMDVDHFKHINDTHGHEGGDVALVRLAQTCRQVLRDIDVIGRIGGEEFAILLPNTPGEGALQVAERLRETLANQATVTKDGVTISFTVSLGVASLAAGNDTPGELLNRADRALYEAKATGRNRVCVAN